MQALFSKEVPLFLIAMIAISVSQFNSISGNIEISRKEKVVGSPAIVSSDHI
jgi:hypothetical protein